MRLKNLVEEIFTDLLKKEYVVLVESPVKIKALNDDQLQNNYKNLEFTKIVKEKAKEKKGVFDGYEIYSYTSESYVIDVFVEGELTIAFFMYEEKDNNFIESKVWQDAGHPGLCRNLLLNYYLSMFNSIISDGVHSEMGEKYWMKLLEKAKSLGHKTLVVLPGGHVQDFDKNLVDQYYSSPNTRFVIQKISA
jgi:hypothetical protein